LRKGRNDRNEVRADILLALGCGVFIVWSVVVIGGFFLSRPVDNAVHGITAIVMTGLFGGSALAERKANGKQNGN
jgi:hypothetical protein